jgi:hypothetical protein
MLRFSDAERGPFISIYLWLHTIAALSPRPGDGTREKGPMVEFKLTLVNREDPSKSISKGTFPATNLELILLRCRTCAVHRCPTLKHQ